MRPIFIFIITLFCALCAFAQTETPDSVKALELNEVVVEAQMQRTSSNVTTYYPDRNSKRTAQNAIDLLSSMAIPQINVNPIGGTVTTPSGDEVSIYIDMEPATQEEKDALRPEDVKKVEYFVFPTDPRFNHAKYVINITLKHYNYGGYAKVSGTGNIMAGSGSGVAYAKMSYKRMTYDISVNDKYTDRHHTGNEQTQVFRFPDNNGEINEITRSNLLDGSRFQQNQFGASFRAKYTSDKAVISNSFFFTALNTPNSSYNGKLVFSSDAFSNSDYTNSLNSTYLYPRWRGNYYFDLGKGFKLNAIPSFFYQHTESDRRYASDNTDIRTDATEDAVTGELQIQLNKSFDRYHTLDVNILGIYYNNRVKYTGNTVATPEFNQFAYGGIVGYTFAKDCLYSQLSVGFAGESNKISGVRTNSLIPLVNLNSQYAFNQKNQISLSAMLNIRPVEASEKTPDIIQENELLYKTGNLHLKNVKVSKVTLDYTWLPNNKFSLSAFTGWSRDFNRIVPVFTPDGPDGLMIRTLENDGYYQNFYFGTSLTAKLLNRSLVLRATPQMWFEKISGIYADTNSYLSLSLNATYYIGKFYVSAYYSPAFRELVSQSLTATSVKRKTSYQLKVGWSNGSWNFTAAAVNIFRRNWISETSRLESKWFDQYTTEYGASSHQFVSLTASYIFGFGKKVRRGDEVQTMGAGNSAIMK